MLAWSDPNGHPVGQALAKYVAASSKRHHLTDNLADSTDVNAELPNIGMSSSLQSDTSLVAGGGEFSGGGASGSFGEFDSMNTLRR